MKLRIWAALVVVTVVMAKAEAQLAVSHGPSTASGPSAALPSAKGNLVTPGPASGKPVARVNGTELYDRDLLREMYTIFPYAQQHNGFPKQLEPEIRRGALEMIVFEELVYQEAKRRNLQVPAAKMAGATAAFRKQFPSPAAYKSFLRTETNGSETAMREKIRRALLIESLLNQEVSVPARITTAQAQAYYQKHIQEYRHGEILHIQSISIVPPDETKAVLQEAKRRAEEAAKQAKQAKSYRDFGLLAEKLSDDDFHVNMGDHKAQPAAALPPPLLEVLAKMKVGEVSDLIHLGPNYTIVRLEKRTPAGTAPFAEVKAKLQAEMQKARTEQLRSALGQKLRKNAKIEVL